MTTRRLAAVRDALAASLRMLLDPTLRAAAVAGSPHAGAGGFAVLLSPQTLECLRQLSIRISDPRR